MYYACTLYSSFFCKYSNRLQRLHGSENDDELERRDVSVAVVAAAAAQSESVAKRHESTEREAWMILGVERQRSTVGHSAALQHAMHQRRDDMMQGATYRQKAGMS